MRDDLHENSAYSRIRRQQQLAAQLDAGQHSHSHAVDVEGRQGQQDLFLAWLQRGHPGVDWGEVGPQVAVGQLGGLGQPGCAAGELEDRPCVRRQWARWGLWPGPRPAAAQRLVSAHDGETVCVVPLCTQLFGYAVAEGWPALGDIGQDDGLRRAVGLDFRHTPVEATEGDDGFSPGAPQQRLQLVGGMSGGLTE